MTKLTTVAGAPVANNQDSLTAGPRGPMLLQDVWHLEKMAHFNREVMFDLGEYRTTLEEAPKISF